MKRLEVDFPETGLPKDMELVGIEYGVPAMDSYYFDGRLWTKVLINFKNSYLTAILKPKEVWLPCTPEDAFAKMLNPESRVIRMEYDKVIVQTVLSLGTVGVCLSAGGLPHNAAYPQLEVLKTKEIR